MLTEEQIITISNIFRESIYESKCIPDALAMEAKRLRESGIPGINVFARALEESSKTRRRDSKNFVDITRIIVDWTIVILKEKFPDLFFEISSRRKSFLSEHHKRFSRFLRGESPYIRDMVAIRLVILNDPLKETEYKQLIVTCYDVINTLIEYFCDSSDSDLDLLLVEAEAPSNKKPFQKEEYPEVVLPDSSGILDEYLYGIKDYILKPKEKGYQSIHLVLQIAPSSPKCGGMDFEIQLRTLRMHLHSEYGDANHQKYKDDKLCVDSSLDWKEHFKIDFDKVNFTGFKVSDNGDVLHDSCGFVKPIALYSRHHTVPY